jgi:hypothetical protein
LNQRKHRAIDADTEGQDANDPDDKRRGSSKPAQSHPDVFEKLAHRGTPLRRVVQSPQNDGAAYRVRETNYARYKPAPPTSFNRKAMGVQFFELPVVSQPEL